MAVRTVLQLGDPGLREIAKRVEDPTGAGDSRTCGGPCRHSRVLEENDGLRTRDRCPADWVSTACDLLAIARLRALAFRESRNYGKKRRENRGLGRLSELPLDFYASGAASRDFHPLPGPAWRVAHTPGGRRAESVGTLATRDRSSRWNPRRGSHHGYPHHVYARGI